MVIVNDSQELNDKILALEKQVAAFEAQVATIRDTDPLLNVSNRQQRTLMGSARLARILVKRMHKYSDEYGANSEVSNTINICESVIEHIQSLTNDLQFAHSNINSLV